MLNFYFLTLSFLFFFYQASYNDEKNKGVDPPRPVIRTFYDHTKGFLPFFFFFFFFFSFFSFSFSSLFLFLFLSNSLSISCK